MQTTPITTGIRLGTNIQVDGRIAVRELHEADSGETNVVMYIADPEDDLDAMLISNGHLFLARLADA